MANDIGKFLEHNIIEFYKIASELYSFSGSQKTFTGQLTKLNVSRLCEKVETIATMIEGTGFDVQKIRIMNKEFTPLDWINKELRGYSKRDRIPFYRIMGDTVMTSPITYMENSLFGMEMEQTITIRSKLTGKTIMRVSDLIHLFDRLRIELNKYIALVAQKAEMSIEEQSSIDLPPEFAKLYDSGD